MGVGVREAREAKGRLLLEVCEPSEDMLEVTIDQAPRCNCLEYDRTVRNPSSTWVHCRHVYAVLWMGLGGGERVK